MPINFNQYKLYLLIIGLFLITGCGINNKDIENKLPGKWKRTDGPYIIEIKDVKQDGKLLAYYFNPDTINIGRSGWRIRDDALKMYIELSDVNYPGSIYQLTFDEQNKQLYGSYYQAVSKQTYEVKFTKSNK